MDYSGIQKILTDVREEYEREMCRGIRQRDLTKAHDALVGTEVVERITQRINLQQAADDQRLAEIEREVRRSFRPRRMERSKQVRQSEQGAA